MANQASNHDPEFLLLFKGINRTLDLHIRAIQDLRDQVDAINRRLVRIYVERVRKVRNGKN